MLGWRCWATRLTAAATRSMSCTTPGTSRSSSRSRPGPRSRAGSAWTTSSSMTTPARRPADQVTRPISSSRKVTFGAACAGCPFRARCTTSRTGRKLTLRPHDALQRAHRVRAATPEFQTVYRRHRPMVERFIAWLVRGNRLVPYRGVDKNHAGWVTASPRSTSDASSPSASTLTREPGPWPPAKPTPRRARPPTSPSPPPHWQAWPALRHGPDPRTATPTDPVQGRAAPLESPWAAKPA